MKKGDVESRGKIVIIGAIVLLGMLELVSRYALGLGEPPLYIAHPTIEYMFKPNQEVSRFHNKIIINEYGMRSSDFSAQREDSGELRIMMFGDSVLNGGSLTSHEKLASTLLQKELNRKLKKPVIAGNISAGSWGPGNWLGYVNQFGFFDADIVVVLMSGHDIADNPQYFPLSSNTHPIKKPVSAVIEGVERYLPRYFDFTSTPIKDKKKLTGFEIEKGISYFDQFLKLALKQTKKVIVIYHPEQDELKLKTHHQGYDYINKVVNDNGLVLKEMMGAYSNSIAKGSNIYIDNIHINEIGQNVLFDYLVDNLI